MPSKRGHEASHGGDELTHREHYDKGERRLDRKDRVEERREARKHFREERGEIREEIDMERAGLTRRLHVKLAEMEELMAQHDRENLSYAVPEDYEEIKRLIESLGDGEDEGEYESKYPKKADRRRVMRNDLQTLRLRVRGLRTSLRRHTSHIDEDNADESDDAPQKDAEAQANAGAGATPTGQGTGSGSGPEGSNGDGGGTTSPAPDPAPTRELEEPTPAPVVEQEELEVVTVPPPSKEEQEAEQKRIEDARKREEEIAKQKQEEEAKRKEEEAKKRAEEEEAQKKKEEAEKEKLVDEAITFLKEKDLGDPYDDDFIDWLGEKHKDVVLTVVETIKADETTDLDPLLEKHFEEYIVDLIAGVEHLLVSEYGIPPEDINEDLTEFWKFYRGKNQTEFLQTVRTLYEGSGTQEGQHALLIAQTLFMTDEFQKHLFNEKLKQEPSKWLEHIMYNEMTEEQRDGMFIQGGLEAGLSLRIENSDEKCIVTVEKVDGQWLLSSKEYPNMFKDEANLNFDSAEEALLQARQVLSEVDRMDTMINEVEHLKGEEVYPHRPFIIGQNGRAIEFADTEIWPNIKTYWHSRQGKYRAEHLVDIYSVVEALNTAYLKKNPLDIGTEAWDPEPAKAKLHFDTVEAAVGKTDENLSFRANSSHTEIVVTNEDDQSVTINRSGSGWTIKSKYPSLTKDLDGRFNDPETGLFEAIMNVNTILIREGEMDGLLEIASSVESPEAFFTISGKGRIEFNGAALTHNRKAINYNYDEDINQSLFTPEQFISALNESYLGLTGQIQLNAQLNAEAELKIEGWRLNYEFDRSLTPIPSYANDWRYNYKAEVHSDSASVKLEEGSSLDIQKEGQNWTIAVPEKYQAFTSGVEKYSYDNFDELIQGYEMLMQTLSKAADSFKAFAEINQKIDAEALNKHETPFYIAPAGNGTLEVRYANGADGLEGRVLQYNPNSIQTSFDIKSLVVGLNKHLQNINTKPEENAEVTVDTEGQGANSGVEPAPVQAKVSEQKEDQEDELDAWEIAKGVGETLIEINDDASGL